MSETQDNEQKLVDLIDARVAAKSAEVQHKYDEIYEARRVDDSKKGQTTKSPQDRLGSFIKACVIGQNDSEKAAAYCAKSGDAESAEYFKALSATIPDAGGFRVPNVLLNENINYLYANTIMDKVGVGEYPLVNGNARISRLDTAATTYWVGENTAPTITQEGFGEVVLQAKKLMAMVPVSNDYLRFAIPGSDAIITRDLSLRIQNALDTAALYGLGTTYQPIGLSNITASANVVGSSSTAFTTDSPIEFLRLLAQANTPMLNVKWVMSPTGFYYLMNLKSTTGNFIFRDEMAQGRLFGYEIVKSTAVSYTSGSPGYVDTFLGDFSEFLFGRGTGLLIDTSREASYSSGGTNNYSAFAQDQTLIRAIVEVDYNVKHATSFVMSTNKLATT